MLPAQRILHATQVPPLHAAYGYAGYDYSLQWGSTANFTALVMRKQHLGTTPVVHGLRRPSTRACLAP